jgi:hypothetical protein
MAIKCVAVGEEVLNVRMCKCANVQMGLFNPHIRTFVHSHIKLLFLRQLITA